MDNWKCCRKRIGNEESWDKDHRNIVVLDARNRGPFKQQRAPRQQDNTPSSIHALHVKAWLSEPEPNRLRTLLRTRKITYNVRRLFHVQMAAIWRTRTNVCRTPLVPESSEYVDLGCQYDDVMAHGHARID